MIYNPCFRESLRGTSANAASAVAKVPLYCSGRLCLIGLESCLGVLLIAAACI